MDVDRALDLADVHRDFEVVAGECISVGNAIHSVFGGTLIAVSRRANTRSIDHLAVKVNGTLYDGRGEVTADQLVTEFAAARHPSVRNHTWEPTPTDTRPFRGPVYMEAKTRLEEVVKTGRYTDE